MALSRVSRYITMKKLVQIQNTEGYCWVECYTIMIIIIIAVRKVNEQIFSICIIAISQHENQHPNTWSGNRTRDLASRNLARKPGDHSEYSL